MDHSGMDHGGMDHGGMDMGHGDMCSMNMLFTWDTNNLCIVFRSWRVTSTISLIWSLMAIVMLTAGYELVREMARRYESTVQQQIDSLPNHHPNSQPSTSYHDDIPEQSAEDSPLYPRPAGRDSAQAAQKSKIVKAAFYALQVFYSFFIMLLFMTYNGWIMLAVAVGAFIGYLIFGNASATKSAACH